MYTQFSVLAVFSSLVVSMSNLSEILFSMSFKTLIRAVELLNQSPAAIPNLPPIFFCTEY